MRGTREQWPNEQKHRFRGQKKICITPHFTYHKQAPQNVFQSGWGGGEIFTIKYLRSKWSVNWRGVQKHRPLKLRGFRHLITVG